MGVECIILTAMSYQQKQIFRLNKQLQLREQQFKRERTMLLQKIELLTAQVEEEREKQLKNKQLNESIIITYRQNQSFRQQLNHRELENALAQHQAQLDALKHKHAEHNKQHQQQLQLLRTENQRLRIDAEKQQLEHEKHMAELRRDFEEKHSNAQNDLNLIFTHKMAILAEKLKQAEETAQAYKEQLDLRAMQAYPSESECQAEQESSGSKCCGRQDKLEGWRGSKRSHESSCVLQMRINRALVQLHPHHSHLQHKVRQAKFKIY